MAPAPDEHNEYVLPFVLIQDRVKPPFSTSLRQPPPLALPPRRSAKLVSQAPFDYILISLIEDD
jgi:hypothetical protein